MQRRGRRLTRWSTLAALTLVLGLAGSSSVAGQSLDELRDEREALQDDILAKAGDVDAATAEADEVAAVLSDIQTVVSEKEADLDAAEQALDTAIRAVEAADLAIGEVEAQIEITEDRLADLAVEAYLGSDSQGTEASVLTETGDINQAARARVLVDVQFGNFADLADNLRGLRADVEQLRRDRQAAADEATELVIVFEGQLAEVEEARDAQQLLVDAAADRLDARLAEAQALQDIDNGLAAQITAEEEAIARALEEAARRAAEEREREGGGGSSNRPPIPPNSEIVTVQGMSVHVSIVDTVDALLTAARNDGVDLGGSGWRSSQRQIELRQSHCGTSDYAVWEMPASACSPPTARPGQSMHERGLAIDFTYNGRLIRSRSNAGFQWLAANASSYGFVNLPSEPWHWSTTGN